MGDAICDTRHLRRSGERLNAPGYAPAVAYLRLETAYFALAAPIRGAPAAQYGRLGCACHTESAKLAIITQNNKTQDYE